MNNLKEEKLRSIYSMILNALDRDAAEGKVSRGEMAAELREALSQQAEPAPAQDERSGLTELVDGLVTAVDKPLLSLGRWSDVRALARQVRAAQTEQQLGPHGSADRYFFEQGFEHGKRDSAPQLNALLVKGMADALRHTLKELDGETPEDIDYGQLHSALGSYERFSQATSRDRYQLFEIQWPEYRYEGMGCGLEDRGITDRYEACRYGFEEALDQLAQMLPEVLYTDRE